jgi:hypothetical protein
VTAVEVPVRVLLKNEVVKGLTKDDFEVFESGVKQDITTFEVVSRRIADSPELAAAGEKTKPRPRLFILIFDIFDYNDAVGEAIDYFFQNVFREKDQIMILAESRLLNIERGRTVEEIVGGLKDTLKKFKTISTKEILRAYDDLREEGDRLLQDLRSGERQVANWEQPIIRFYERYLHIWKMYQQQFLVPYVGLYELVIRKAKSVEAEKWAICFQQRELFPELRNEGPLEKEINQTKETQVDTVGQMKGRIIQSKQWELQQALDVARNFPRDTLKNLFMDAGITFHLILMRSLKTIVSEDFSLREVASDYENCFKEISQSTGGYLTFSNNAQEALKEASEKEDYHYLLVYQPKGPVETRGKNIEVKVRQEGAQVYNLKQYMKRGGPVMTISDVSGGRKVLKFTLKNYAMVGAEKGRRGIGEVGITLYDDKSQKAFSEGKVLDFVKDEIHITLNLDRLKAGSYFLIIDALDKIANEKDVYSGVIEL